MPLSREEIQQAHAALMADPNLTVRELAESWDVKPMRIYRALNDNNLSLRERERLKNTPEMHVKAQRASGLPPDLYAARHNLHTRSLQHHAYQLQMKLNMASYADKKAWWENALRPMNLAKVQEFIIKHDLPLNLVAYWFHKIENPQTTLLWGGAALRIVTGDMFNDIGRFHNPNAGDTFYLGRGKSLSQIDLRLAQEITRHSYAWGQPDPALLNRA